jgi:excinuclease UvrABC nuclease subunit
VDLSEHEKLIEQYLSEDNKVAAVQLLSELIIKSAKEKKFKQAEALRDRLLEVDSMALNEIVKTGEIIEAEKSNAIDKEHLDTWSKFYESLLPEEICRIACRSHAC